MIVKDQRDVTNAVLGELDRAANPRFKEIMGAAVRHLHEFVREAKLTETEFQQACAYIATLGKLSTESHNEVVLIAGSLGVSSLVCLLNNGEHGQTETTANLLGPFWRMNSPRTANGESIVRSPVPGDPIFVNAWIRDQRGQPVVGADVDVWHTSAEGIYENQDRLSPPLLFALAKALGLSVRQLQRLVHGQSKISPAIAILILIYQASRPPRSRKALLSWAASCPWKPDSTRPHPRLRVRAWLDSH